MLVRSSADAPPGFRQIQPVRLGYLLRSHRTERVDNTLDVHDGKPRHGGGVPGPMGTAAPGTPRFSGQRPLRAPIGSLVHLRQRRGARWTPTMSATRSTPTPATRWPANSWVRRTLAGHRSDPNIDFIVCFFHHCTYSTVDPMPATAGAGRVGRTLFDRYQVDLVSPGPQPRLRADRSHPGRQADDTSAGQLDRSSRIRTEPSITQSDRPVGRATGSSPANESPTGASARWTTSSCPTATCGRPTAASRRNPSSGRGCGSATTHSSGSTYDPAPCPAKWM